MTIIKWLRNLFLLVGLILMFFQSPPVKANGIAETGIAILESAKSVIQTGLSMNLNTAVLSGFKIAAMYFLPKLVDYFARKILGNDNKLELDGKVLEEREREKRANELYEQSMRQMKKMADDFQTRYNELEGDIRLVPRELLQLSVMTGYAKTELKIKSSLSTLIEYCRNPSNEDLRSKLFNQVSELPEHIEFITEGMEGRNVDILTAVRDAYQVIQKPVRL